MEQRRLRLGDILDDYCPRERRVTNHAVVAMVEEDVKQTRCTTCDAEHVYKGGKAPPQEEVGDDRRALQGSPRRHHRSGSAAIPPAEQDMSDEPENAIDAPVEDRRRDPIARCPRGDRPRISTRTTQLHASTDDGPVHRPLIRAQLPRVEGHEAGAPGARIHHPPEQRPRQRPRRSAAAAGSGGGGKQRRPALRPRPASRWRRRRSAAPGGGQGFGRGPGAGGQQRSADPASAAVEASQQLALAVSQFAALPPVTGNVTLMSSLAGKTGLIVGVANKRSIAWAIAQAAAAAGAQLARHLSGRAARGKRPRARRRPARSAAPAARRHRRRADRGGVRGHRSRSSAASTSWCTAPPTRPARISRTRSCRRRATGSRWRSTSAPIR